ncbi:MAG TPA: hypothetical protein VJ596_10350, partial [Gemmatimonadaceae bacterium]|nr:hypothetical protein [Gemmatimonadaceae bacterium]
MEGEIQRDGLVVGSAVQKLEWGTGAPTLSPDGSRVALVLRARDEPGRLVVWSTSDEPEDERRRRARERARARDRQDVPSIAWRPEAKNAIATLYAAGGRSHEEPRFMSDGKRILVVRFEPMGDGSLRPDLFIWNHETGALHRVTHGAGIRHADPSPDGSFAVGDRCLNGSCDIVRIDLASGNVQTLVAGTPDTAYYRPRLSPDGERIAVSMHAGGRWRVGLVDARGGTPTVLAAGDDVERYDAAFLPQGDTLVLVSERGGIANLERMALSTGGNMPLSRVTGAARDPEPHPRDGSIYFLLLHAEGLDLQRLSPDAHPAAAFSLDPQLAPAIPVIARDSGVDFSETTPAPSQPYGLGPRGVGVFPIGTSGAE